MAIPNYIRPQTEIYQQLEITIDVTHGYLAACVIGPQYDLYRYGKEELPAIPFKSEGQTVPFTFNKNSLYDYEVDTDSVRIFAEDLQVSLATFASGKVKVDENDRFVLRLTGGKCFASTTAENIDPSLKGYGVQVSDIVAVTADGATRKAAVLDLVGCVVEPHVEVDNDEVIELSSAANKYDGHKNTSFQLIVLNKDEDTVTLRSTDSDGLTSPKTIELKVDDEGETEFELGLGVSIKFKEGAFETLKLDDVLAVSARASYESETEFDGLRLDAMPIAATAPTDTTLESVDIRLQFFGEITNDSRFINASEVTPEGVTLKDGLSIWIEDQKREVAFLDGEGKLYLQYRVLVMPPADEDVLYFENELEIAAQLGVIDQQNDIAYAAATCLKGAAGRGIYVLRVSGRPDDKDAYLTALQKTQADRTIYSFAVITDSLDIAHAVNTWNEAQCAPDVKNYRRTIYGVDYIPTFLSADADRNGSPIRALFAGADGDTNTTNATIVQLDQNVAFNFKNYNFYGVETEVRPGDYIALDLTGVRYMVRRVLSATELELVSGPKSEITRATSISLYKPDTAANMTEYIQGICSSFNSRRATVVFCDQGMYGNEIVANKYLAAYVAGLSSSVVPQKSITRSEVTALNSCSRMYIKYTRKQLDDMARYGCLLITQNVKNGPCYVRHQLTTETDKGILYYEESCTRNIDNISFSIDATCEQFIGKANVTRSALQTLREKLITTLNRFKTDVTDPLIGSSLVDYDNLQVMQDKIYKDRVNVYVNLYVPAPLNNIRVYEMAYVAEVTIDN